LLAAGGVPAFSAELAHEQALSGGCPVTEVVGAPNPGIYDWELSPYTIDLAVALARRLGSLLTYASLTDFVQHSAAPGEPLSDDFYRAIDVAPRHAIDAGFVVGMVADSGMCAKSATSSRSRRRCTTSRAPGRGRDPVRRATRAPRRDRRPVADASRRCAGRVAR
jgi:hypothetical protein